MSSPRCAPREGRSSAHVRGLHGVTPTPIGMRMAQCAFKSRVLGPPQKKTRPENAPFWPPLPTPRNVVVRALVRDLPAVRRTRTRRDTAYGVLEDRRRLTRRHDIRRWCDRGGGRLHLPAPAHWSIARRRCTLATRPTTSSFTTYIRQVHVSATTRGLPDIGGDASIPLVAARNRFAAGFYHSAHAAYSRGGAPPCALSQIAILQFSTKGCAAGACTHHRVQASKSVTPEARHYVSTGGCDRRGPCVGIDKEWGGCPASQPYYMLWPGPMAQTGAIGLPTPRPSPYGRRGSMRAGRIYCRVARRSLVHTAHDGRGSSRVLACGCTSDALAIRLESNLAPHWICTDGRPHGRRPGEHARAWQRRPPRRQQAHPSQEVLGPCPTVGL